MGGGKRGTNGRARVPRSWQDTKNSADIGRSKPCARSNHSRRHGVMKASRTNPTRLASVLLLTLLALAPAAASALTCYTLFDRNDSVLYRGTFPPIDMSPDGDAQRDAMRSQGQFLVFADAENCYPVEYRFGEAGSKTLSIENIIGGIRPMAVTRSGLPSSGATRSGAPPAT